MYGGVAPITAAVSSSWLRSRGGGILEIAHRDHHTASEGGRDRVSERRAPEVDALMDAGAVGAGRVGKRRRPCREHRLAVGRHDDVRGQALGSGAGLFQRDRFGQQLAAAGRDRSWLGRSRTPAGGGLDPGRLRLRAGAGGVLEKLCVHLTGLRGGQSGAQVLVVDVEVPVKVQLFVTASGSAGAGAGVADAPEALAGIDPHPHPDAGIDRVEVGVERHHMAHVLNDAVIDDHVGARKHRVRVRRRVAQRRGHREQFAELARGGIHEVACGHHHLAAEHGHHRVRRRRAQEVDPRVDP